MTDAIFLSAGVPDPKQGPEYAATADAVAIAAAVSALLHVTLGRRQIVWGGQPSITPMIWVMAEALGIDYGGWVKLYQSRYFEDEYPEDNQRFQNVVYTDAVPDDRERSLLSMREHMFSECEFTAAVFIGGMEGVIQEFDLLRRIQPQIAMVPVISTGGAVIDIAKRMNVDPSSDLRTDMDYVALLHRRLGVSVQEMRFKQPKDQPEKVVDRLWSPKMAGE